MKYLLHSFLAIGLLAWFATSCTISSTSSSESVDQNNVQTEVATVVYVVDGDTVRLNIDGVEESVRLIGIDTPEARAGNQPVQCYGREASDYLTGLLPAGTEVSIARDVEARDRYDRLLLYLYKDDIFINEQLVLDGYANARSYFPNTSKQNILDSALSQAKSQNKGLWAVCENSEQPL